MLLFRFSALTANAHRIHYDTPCARDEEGYAGLVVHGRLPALLMLERHAFRQRSPSVTRGDAALTPRTAAERRRRP
ncbi:hypothetical protein ACIPSA_25140 [Streptomyces sp. NPDC086549]|uniref:hypothetical protein n=1 Tax=Streptomyces sp. NPDC086549 TaxID=3365752 RepID=UPI003829624B